MTVQIFLPPPHPLLCILCIEHVDYMYAQTVTVSVCVQEGMDYRVVYPWDY